MKTNPPLKTKKLNRLFQVSSLILLAAVVSSVSASAATLTMKATGTWDFNNTASFNGSKWTNNADTAYFDSSGNLYVNVDDSKGQVGANGLTFGNYAGNWFFANQPLQIGPAGVANTLYQAQLSFSNSVQLTASQVWSMNNKYKDFLVYSNLSGTANLTFNALNYNGRLILAGANSLSGTMTVQNAGRVLLDYGVVGQNNSKLDPNSSLVLSNSADIQWQGGSTALTQVLNGLTLAGSGDFYLNRAGQANVLQLGTLNRTGTGSTLRFGNTSGAVTTTTANQNGILGGWAATPAGWAANAGDGSLLESQGTADNDPSTGWTATENVNHNGTLANPVTTRTINTLRLGGPASLDLSGATLTLAAGGLMAVNANPTLQNGVLQSGLASGELFAWTLNGQTLSSYATLQDNGSTPGVLVKAGNGTLTLVGPNTYTGPTYVNQGTLQVADGGNLSSNTVSVAYNGTLSINRGDACSMTNRFTSFGTVRYDGYVSLDLYTANAVFGVPVLNNTTPGQVLNTSSGTLNLNLGGTNVFGLVQNSSYGTLTVNAANGSTNTFGQIKNNAGGTLVLNGSANATNFVNNGFAGSDSGNITFSNAFWTSTGQRNFKGNLTMASGTLQVTGDRFSISGTSGQTVTMTGGTVLIPSSIGYGYRFGGDNGSGSGGYTPCTGIQSGGTVNIYKGGNATCFSLGGNNGLAGAAISYTLSDSGVMNLIGNGTDGSLTIGADTTGNSTTTFALAGGTLKVTGNGTSSGILGSQGSGAKQVFAWTGGTLSCGAYNAANLQSAPGGAYGTLNNGGGTLAPGGLGVPGKTIVNGSYTVTSPSATLAIDIGGATQANAFTNSFTNYDFVSVSGTATLGGLASANLLNNFTPAATNSFTILSAGSIVGTGANIGFSGYVPVSSNGLSLPGRYFQAVVIGTNLLLTNYGVALPTLAASFTPTNTVGTSPLPVSFTDTSAGAITNRHWDFGDYTTLDTLSNNVTHTFTSLGTYMVVLTVRAIDGATSSATGRVSVVNAGDILTWTGAHSDAWDLSTLNWLNQSLNPSLYADADGVIFNDSSSVTNVTLNRDAAPYSVDFNNTARSYTISGTGRITGGTGLNVNSGGSVTLLTANSFVGPTTVNGALQLGNGTVSGSIDSSSAITDNGALVFAQPDDHTLNGSLSGSGSLTKTGNGTLTLAGNNGAFYGSVTINGGVLAAADYTGFGSTTTLTLGNGGLARFTAGPTYYPYSLTLTSGGGGLDHSQSITLYGGGISGTGPFIKAGNGMLILAADYTTANYSGATVVRGGTLQLGQGYPAGAVPGALALNGGNLVLNRGDTYAPTSISGNSVASSITINATPAGFTNTLTMADGLNTFGSILNNSAADLALSGSPNSTNVINGALRINAGFTLNFSGGAWQYPNPGFGNGGQSGTGSCVVNNGAQLYLANATWLNWTNILVSDSNSAFQGNNTIIFYGARGLVTITNNGTILSTNGSVQVGNYFGPAYSGYQQSLTVNQSSGAMLLTGNKTLSLGGAASGYTNLYNLSGGTVSSLGGTGGNLTLGADTNGVNLARFSMTGGKLLVSGTISGSQGAGAQQVFDFSGGTLAAATIDMTRLTSGGATTGTAASLTNNGGILAPGDTNVAGRTRIVGDYFANTAGAVLDIDLGGTTQATAFQHTNACYDTVAITGNAALAGSLRLRLLDSFEPRAPAGQSFVILTAANITGAFANVASGSRLAVQGYPNRSFRVTVSSTNVVLDQYQTDTAQAYFTYGPATGLAPLTVTFTNLANGVGLTNLWNFGDGATSASTAATVTHTYNVAGTNTVSLTVGNALGVNTYTVSNAVIVTDATGVLPVASFTATPLTGVRPLLVTFTDTSTDATTLAWDFGDGVTTNTTAGAVVQHTYLRENVYPVTLVATGAGGSSTNNSLAISVLAPNAPKVTSLRSAAGLLTLQGSNGPVSAGQTYYYQLLTSTNVALARPNWTILSTNAFNPDGTFSNSLPVTPGEPRRFYLLQMP